jgi:hypothetical protein
MTSLLLAGVELRVASAAAHPLKLALRNVRPGLVTLCED